MTTSRMIFGAALGFALAGALGCGSKPAPTQPTAALQEPEPKNDPAPAPQAELPKPAPAAKIVAEMDADKHAVPTEAVRGRIAGTDVTPEVLVTSEELIFRVLKPGTQTVQRSVIFKLAPRVPGQPPPAPAPGRNWKVKRDAEPGPAVPTVWLETQGQPIIALPSGYALTLELGPRKNGKVTGKVYFVAPEEQKTELAGTFTAEYLRFQMEPPGADDAPYITGEVTLVGAAPDAKVRTTCAAFLPSGGAQFTDGVQPTAQYEYVKLEPGRYLISAGVTNGPAVWKWFDVAPGATATENFTIDATKSGGIEVSAAPDAKGKVLVAPADDPSRPPLDASLFEALSVQVFPREKVEVVVGKALVKNLAPGRYEVRFGNERRIVDVVAGKTAEVNLLPPKK